MCLRCCTILRLGEDGADDGRMSPEHPNPILHAHRDNISRKVKSLTPMYMYIYIHIYIYMYMYAYMYIYMYADVSADISAYIYIYV